MVTSRRVEEHRQNRPADAGEAEIGAPRESRPTWPMGKLIAQRYELERTLGGGSMGDVYLAHDRLLRKPIALKVLHAELAQNRDTVRRFLREVALAHSVTHPNVVRIYDTGEEDGLPFFTMEFLQGQTLEELLEHTGGRDGFEKLSIREIREIACDVLDAMEAAHRVGVVHRDLKPGNVMLTHRGAIVMDFGVAGIDDVPDKLPSAANLRSLVRTEAGTIFGSPAYMAPELWEGAAASVQSDLYAFGVVLYQMLTGRLPYDAKTPAAYLQLLGSTQPLPIRSFRRDAPWNLVRLARRCMANEPEDRPPTAEAAANLLAPLRSSDRRRMLIAMGLAGLVAAGTAVFWPTPAWQALGLPNEVAQADLEAAVRTFDWGDDAAALHQLERLAHTAPRSAAVVFWRATVHEALADSSARLEACASHDQPLLGAPRWQALARAACAPAFTIELPFPEQLDDADDDDLALLPLWVEYDLLGAMGPRATSAELWARVEAALARGPTTGSPFDLSERWTVAHADLAASSGDPSAALRRLGGPGPEAPIIKRRLVALTRYHDDIEDLHPIVDTLRGRDPRPHAQTLLEQGRLQAAWTFIRAHERGPFAAALRELWCGYAFRFGAEALPAQCSELEPSLIRALWLGASDDRTLSELARTVAAAHRALERGDCQPAAQLEPRRYHLPAPFELYAAELALAGALCRQAPARADLTRARELAAHLGTMAGRHPWVLLLQAEVEALDGSTRSARAKRRAALERWGNSDPDLPTIRATKAASERSRIGAMQLPS